MVNHEEQHRRRDDVARRRCGAALAELYKALKAMGFYPPGHPLRSESLRLAFGLLREAAGEEPLLLEVGKGGFTSAGGDAAIENSPMAQSLARELFIRRVRRLAFLVDLSSADLESFLTLLTLDHRSIPVAGGMESLMAQRGITTIWANEIDLTVIGRKRQEIQESFAAAGHSPGSPDAGAFQYVAAAPEGEAAISSTSAEFHAEVAQEQAAADPEELIELMARETDDERYRELARAFAKECGRLQEGGEFERLMPLLDRLLQQAEDGGMGIARRGCALLAFERAVGEGMLAYLVQRLEAQGAKEGECILAFFAELGSRGAAPLAARLRCVEDARSLKNLAAGLMAVGEESVPLVVELLSEGRGPVVQAAAGILGEIGTSGCVTELRRCLVHPDEGVRRESLRSLARIGGPEAEEAIIGCLDPSCDQAIRRLAAVSLGALRSVGALEPLLAVVAEGDIFLRTFLLKKDALAALGRIGDRRAVPLLVELLGSRRWFFRRRNEELRCLAATVLGQIGDPAFLPLLAALKAKGGRLGEACGAAADAIGQRGGSHG